MWPSPVFRSIRKSRNRSSRPRNCWDTAGLFNVPKYDFNWQLQYDLKTPIRLPEGTRIDCIAHFDNSPNNKYNPDPAKEVKWGDQTWEEMMIGWFTYSIPVAPAPAATKVGN